MRKLTARQGTAPLTPRAKAEQIKAKQRPVPGRDDIKTVLDL
jgi:hypothetical protein